MKITQYPLCCGACVVYDFGGTNVTLGTKGITPPKDVDRQLKNYQHTYGPQIAFLTSILNPDQEKKYGDVLKSNGWELVAENFHPGHKHDLFFYVYKCKKEEKDGTNGS